MNSRDLQIVVDLAKAGLAAHCANQNAEHTLQLSIALRKCDIAREKLAAYEAAIRAAEQKEAEAKAARAKTEEIAVAEPIPGPGNG